MILTWNTAVHKNMRAGKPLCDPPGGHWQISDIRVPVVKQLPHFMVTIRLNRFDDDLSIINKIIIDHG